MIVNRETTATSRLGIPKMKKQELRDLLYQHLGSILAGSGFRLKKREEAFTRIIVDGRQILGVPLWDYKPIFKFSLNVGIRLESVEAMFHKFSGTSPELQPLNYTVVTRLDYFAPDIPKQIHVTSKAEVESVFVNLSTVIRDRIIPFLDRHKDLTSLDALANPDEEPPVKFDITRNPAGAMHAIILAYLAKNGSFKDILSKKRSEVGSELCDEVAHPFHQLVDYLLSSA